MDERAMPGYLLTRCSFSLLPDKKAPLLYPSFTSTILLDSLFVFKMLRLFQNEVLMRIFVP
jgi:hypothetical protein